MARTNYVVLALVGLMAPLCDADSFQVEGAGNLVRSEPVKPHTQLEKIEDKITWPMWEKFLPSDLSNVTFVQIGHKGKIEGDPIYGYAAKHHWRGIALEPNPTNFAGLKENYAQFALNSVTPIQLAVAEKDGTMALKIDKNANATTVPAVSLPTLWKKHVVGQLSKVDILAMDSGHAVKLLLKGQLDEPKPQFILYDYAHVPRSTLKKMNNNLENQGYKYLTRNGETELHQKVGQ